METERLQLRHWKKDDAESLFKYASDPEVGPRAGWPAHKSIEESRYVLENILSGPECYAIVEKGSEEAIGAIELRLMGNSSLAQDEKQCELGYWLARPYWGRGYMTEAAKEILHHGFMDLGMDCIWCGYYEGNLGSRRVQEKLGFSFYERRENIPVPVLGDTRVNYINLLRHEDWKEKRS